MTDAGETGPGVVYQGVIILEWPEPHPIRQHGVQPLQGWATTVFDALSGKQITTVTGIEIHVPANGLVTADVIMFTDEIGQPVYAGRPHLQDDEVLSGMFRFLVAEMRVRKPAPDRAPLEPRFVEPCAS